jgi:predicted methyltransferase
VALKTTMAAAALALLSVQTPVGAQEPRSGQAAAAEARGDALSNPAYRGPEVIAFMGVKPGDRVVDLVAGRFARALAEAVGPTGKVYAVEPDEVVKVHPTVLTMMQGLATSPQYRNIEVVTGPVDRLSLPGRLDAVFIRQNYHDLHDRFMGPADVARFNRRVLEALKPGGVYVVLDHAAKPGSALEATETLHRIDPQAVISEVTAAGFVLDGRSDLLANPADPHDSRVFDPSIRGHTDQFLLRFRKPG